MTTGITASSATDSSRPDSSPTASDLVDLVAALPGVSGMEPGVATTLRTLDARIRRAGADASHFGVHVDHADGTVTVEVSVDRLRPIRESVRDIQQTLGQALRDTLPEGTKFHVRVQSLASR